MLSFNLEFATINTIRSLCWTKACCRMHPKATFNYPSIKTRHTKNDTYIRLHTNG